jgi:N utilization substance protein B
MDSFVMDVRSNARLAAVQALYQMEVSGAGVDSVVLEFIEHRLGQEMEGSILGEADGEFFSEIVKGVVNSQKRVDRLIDENLAKNWKLSRLDATARSILRAAVFELISRPDIPGKVVMDEYLEISKAFFESEEPKFINGVLDSIWRLARAEEIAGGR